MILSAVVDSSCLIVLERIGRLGILRECFDHVFAPPEVLEEFGKDLEWIEVVSPENKLLVSALSLRLHRGEAAAIALTTEIPQAAAVLDDRKARLTANQVNIPVMGTIGMVLRAKRLGVVQRVRPVLDDLARCGFFLTASLRARALQLAGEAESD